VSGVDGYEPLPSKTEEEARDKDQTSEALKRLIPDWIRTGRMVTGSSGSKGGTGGTVGNTMKVTHGLKRKPAGWIVVRPRLIDAVGTPANDPQVVEVACDVSTITLFVQGGGGRMAFDLWVW
jgi:hypothetical protein